MDDRVLADLRRFVSELGVADERTTDSAASADAAFQRAVDALGTDPLVATLEKRSPGIRAIVATRFLEATIANGGWAAVFFEPGDVDVLPHAIDGYRTLGLQAHAALAEEAAARFAASANLEDATLHELDDRWFELDDAETFRDSFVAANPAEFARFDDPSVE
jgi:hypothetical protein